jgi:hypothetical protein
MRGREFPVISLAAEPAWDWRVQRVEPAVMRATLLSGGTPLTMGAVLARWSDDGGFRAFWTCSLRDLPFAAYCWEMPPLTRAVLDRPFECVFVASPALAAVRADPRPFAQYLSRAEDAAGAVTFDNLGRDALLVAPNPRAETAAYAHLAVFLRRAPADQAQAFWCSVALAVESRLGDVPIWLSTAGLGVRWLHVRIDARPKYYRHAEYARRDFWPVL